MLQSTSSATRRRTGIVVVVFQQCPLVPPTVCRCAAHLSLQNFRQGNREGHFSIPGRKSKSPCDCFPVAGVAVAQHAGQTQGVELGQGVRRRKS